MVFKSNQLTGVRMPDSVMTIGLNAFADNPWLSAHSEQVEAIIAKDYRTITWYDLANLHWLRICHLSFNLDGGSWTGVMSLTSRENDPFPVLSLPEKPWYIFDGREPEFPQKITGDQTFKAHWQQLYTLHFDLDWRVGTTVLTGFYYGDAFPAIADLIKTWYVFGGLNPILPSTVTETKTYKALWEVASSPTPGRSSGGSSGVWGFSLRRDNCPNGDYFPSYYDSECGTSTATGTRSIATGSVSIETQNADSLKDEQTQAYERVYQ